jgi:hypothetical protein
VSFIVGFGHGQKSARLNGILQRRQDHVLGRLNLGQLLLFGIALDRGIRVGGRRRREGDEYRDRRRHHYTFDIGSSLAIFIRVYS